MRNCQILMIRVTTSGTVGVTAKKQVWPKIASRTTEFINQYCGFEHTVVIYRQPVGL